MRITETEDGWVIPFEEAVISAIQIDFRFTLLIEDRNGVTQVIIEIPFRISGSGNDYKIIDPSNSASLAPTLGLFNAKVDKILIRKNGFLSIEFLDGTLVMVNFDESYEAWQVSSLDSYMLTCEPGGHVSFFMNP